MSLMLTLFFYLSAPPVPTVFWITPPPPLGPISYRPHHLSPVESASISLFTRFYTPISPGRGVTVHLENAPALRLPPLVCASLPPSNLDLRTIPLTAPSGGVTFSVPHPLWIRLALLDLLRVISWCLLDSWLPIKCPFAIQWEAWAPPLLSNRLPSPPPLR